MQKNHNIPSAQFEKFVFFSHVINGCQLTVKGIEKSIKFEMTGADRDKSVGDWGGEGIAKIPIDNKKVINALMSHPLYNKQIFRIPSPAEIEYRSNQVKGKEYIKRMREGIKKGYNKIDLKALDKEQLQSLANDCGISAFKIDEATFKKGAEKSLNALMEELSNALGLTTGEKNNETK